MPFTPSMIVPMMAPMFASPLTMPNVNMQRPRGEAAPGLCDIGMINPQFMMAREQLLSQVAYGKAKDEFKIELEQLAGARADAARLRASNEEKDSTLIDLQSKIDRLQARAAQAETRAAEVETQTARKVREVQQAADVRDAKAAKAAAAAQKKHEKEMAALKAVHAATIHRRVQEDGRERQERLAAMERLLGEQALQAHEQLELERAEVAEQLKAAKTARGMAEAKAESYRLAEAKRGGTSTKRIQAATLSAEVCAARAAEPELRETIRELRENIGELEATVDQLKEQLKATQQAADGQPIYSTRPLKHGSRFLPEALVLVRHLVTSCHIPQRNVSCAIDVCFTLFTGLIPGADYQVSATLVVEALRKLGTMDKEREAAAAATDPDPYSINSDTGNDGTEREVAALGTWSRPLNAPVAKPLCCAHIAHDQSGRNGADVLDRQLDLAGRKPELCVGAGGDSTDHAIKQRTGLEERLVAKGLEASRMLIYGCVRHFKELELKAAFEAGWPGNVAENFLFSLRYIIHKDVPFWRGVWTDSGAGTGPVNVYNSSLASMPNPTSSKWECMDVACAKFVATYEVSEARRGIGVTMIEEFVDRTRHLLRGTTDMSMPQKAGTHGDKEKFNVLAADLQNMQLMGAIFATLDLARENSGPFHEWSKQLCPIYGWGNDFKAHLMAVKACEEADFWERAEADSAVAFPQLHAFMRRSFNRQYAELMNAEACRKLTASMKAAIKAGREKNAEWMLKQYTAAPFLYGVVTDERHRLLAAQLILSAVGHEAQLKAKMAAAQISMAQPAGAVQLRLQACFQREAASGELRTWWARWGLDASLNEWLLLATAPSQNYHNEPCSPKA